MTAAAGKVIDLMEALKESLANPSGPKPKERPILFSGPMVRAILEGRKTQTRRVVKPQPIVVGAEFPSDASWWVWNTTHGRKYVSADSVHDRWPEALLPFCPYGQPGDRLWVRESWTADFGNSFSDAYGAWWHQMPKSLRTSKAVQWLYYAADESVYHGPETIGGKGLPPENRQSTWIPDEDDLAGRRWVPSIHMPRWASRLTLEITEVRVQRLQEISDEDAIAEGAFPDDEYTSTDRECRVATYVFQKLWDSLNAKRGFGWDKNPYVWALSFRRVD